MHFFFFFNFLVALGLVAMHGLSLASPQDLLQWLLLLPTVVAHGLNWPTACGIFPGPGIETRFPAMAGFLATELPGSPSFIILVFFLRYN